MVPNVIYAEEYGEAIFLDEVFQGRELVGVDVFSVMMEGCADHFLLCL